MRGRGKKIRKRQAEQKVAKSIWLLASIDYAKPVVVSNKLPSVIPAGSVLSRYGYDAQGRWTRLD